MKELIYNQNELTRDRKLFMPEVIKLQKYWEKQLKQTFRQL